MQQANSSEDNWDSIIAQVLNDQTTSNIKFVIKHVNVTKEYYCHKLILSLKGCPYFKQLAKQTLHDKSIDDILTFKLVDSVSHVGFEYILESIYGSHKFGNIQLNSNNIATICFAVKFTNFDKLIRKCIKFIAQMAQNQNVNTFYQILLDLEQLLPTHILQQLLQDGIIIKNIHESFWSDTKLGKLQARTIQMLVGSDFLQISEDYVWYYMKQMCQNIATHEHSDWKQIMRQFVPCIRFVLIKDQYFSEEIRCSGVLSTAEVYAIYDHKLWGKPCDFNNEPRYN